MVSPVSWQGAKVVDLLQITTFLTCLHAIVFRLNKEPYFYYVRKIVGGWVRQMLTLQYNNNTQHWSQAVVCPI